MVTVGAKCKIRFLPVVLEPCPGVFNNSVLAVSGDFSPGRQRAAASQDTYSFSQSEWGRMCGKLLTAYSTTRWSPFMQLSPKTVPFLFLLTHIVVDFPAI